MFGQLQKVAKSPRLRVTLPVSYLQPRLVLSRYYVIFPPLASYLSHQTHTSPPFSTLFERSINTLGDYYVHAHSGNNQCEGKLNPQIKLNICKLPSFNARCCKRFAASEI